MNKSNMKNMVVLKDLPSNIVEEAIVVLKNNAKVNKKQFSKKAKKEDSIKEVDKVQDKKYIVKEAEMVILNYLKEIENPIKQRKNQNILQKKCEKLKKTNGILLVISFICIVAFLIK